MKNNSHFKKCISITCQFLVLLSLSFSSFSQSDYPNRAIKVVVPFAPGSVPESVLRIFTQEMTARFGHPIVIEHKPGASTNMAAAYVANAPADGYTLLLTNLASNILNKSTYKKLAYEPDAFMQIGLMAVTGFYVVVRADSPYQSMNDLIQAAQNSPVSFKYGSLGSGGASHLVTELFRTKTGIKELLHVPYKSGAALDLIAGRLDFMIDASVINQVKSGQLKALAVASSKRWPTLPDLPTTTELGYPDVTMSAIIGLSAPAKTPAGILDKLNQTMIDVGKNPENIKRILAMHAMPVSMTRAETQDYIKQQSEKWKPVIQSLQISFED